MPAGPTVSKDVDRAGRLDRRTFVGRVGAAIAAGLAGCGATDDRRTPAGGSSPGVEPEAEPAPTPSPEGRTRRVTSTADGGSGSLREALERAAPRDTVTFDPSAFPPTAPATIDLDSGLPALDTGRLTIDASEVGVVLDGTGLGDPDAVGLAITSDDNAVRGLQLVGFPLAGIGLRSGARNNTIGGDRGVGAGPTGQGVSIVGSGTFGIGLWDEATAFNTIRGSVIGTDPRGTTVRGAFSRGVHVEGAHDTLVVDNLIGGYRDIGVGIDGGREGHNTVRDNHVGTGPGAAAGIAIGRANGVEIRRSRANVIGPANVIAHNGGIGIAVAGGGTVENRVTENSIHDNGGAGDAFLALGIETWDGGNAGLAAPVVLDYDLGAGRATGLARPGATVEVFSDRAEEGAIFEGRTMADEAGGFVLETDAPFTGPHLTATSTDADGDTSEFSVPTPAVSSRRVAMQSGNGRPIEPFRPRRARDLADNHIGGGWERRWILDLGATRASFSVNEIESGARGELVDWRRPEFEIDPQLDALVTDLADHGLDLTVTLSFWDKANHPNGWDVGAGASRFQTAEEVERYLEFVRFVVGHFRDRVRYFELWNEPDNRGHPLQYIRIPDYVTLVERVVPVIREDHPEAKVVVGSVSNLMYTRDYLFALLESEAVMALADVVAWHPFYGASPSYGDDPRYGNPRAYYDAYPQIVRSITDTATAHGFRGEYYVDEMSWPTPEIAVAGQPWTHSLAVSAKYYARGVVTHRGLGVNTEVGSMSAAFVTPYATVRNLCTVLAGASPTRVPAEVRSEATDVMGYGFSRPGGERLLAVWTDGPAAEHEPGVPATLVLAGLAGRRVTGIDPLVGFQQVLDTRSEDGNLVVPGLLVKDYPIVLRMVA